MAKWLMKSEPETFSWDDLVRDGKTQWDGVRNYAARQHLNAMQAGDAFTTVRIRNFHSIGCGCEDV